MRNLSNQKHRDPENLSLRLHYGESLKQYRNTLQKKKEQHVRNQLNVIEESIDSNKQQHKGLSIQHGDVWINHFSFITKNKQQKHLHDHTNLRINC